MLHSHSARWQSEPYTHSIGVSDDPSYLNFDKNCRFELLPRANVCIKAVFQYIHDAAKQFILSIHRTSQDQISQSYSTPITVCHIIMLH